MIKLKDLIKIMPNPTEFYLCVMDDHDNATKHPDEYVYSICNTVDFKTFSLSIGDKAGYSQDRILELLEYEVTCIINYMHSGRLTNGGHWKWEETQRSKDGFFVFVDKPLEKKRRK